jgi:hypothetical protein
MAVFVAVTVTAYIAVLFGYGWYADTFLIHDFEGATAMGVAIAPAVAVAVGLAAAIWAWVRVARRTAKP